MSYEGIKVNSPFYRLEHELDAVRVVSLLVGRRQFRLTLWSLMYVVEINSHLLA